jgi:hypothetical protein
MLTNGYQFIIETKTGKSLQELYIDTLLEKKERFPKSKFLAS